MKKKWEESMSINGRELTKEIKKAEASVRLLDKLFNLLPEAEQEKRRMVVKAQKKEMRACVRRLKAFLVSKWPKKEKP